MEFTFCRSVILESGGRILRRASQGVTMEFRTRMISLHLLIMVRCEFWKTRSHLAKGSVQWEREKGEIDGRGSEGVKDKMKCGVCEREDGRQRKGGLGNFPAPARKHLWDTTQRKQWREAVRFLFLQKKENWLEETAGISETGIRRNSWD